MVLSDASQQLGPSLLTLGRFLFLSVGLGLDMKWAGLAKSFGPTKTNKTFIFRLNWLINMKQCPFVLRKTPKKILQMRPPFSSQVSPLSFSP